jgi:hypothetical protein
MDYKKNEALQVNYIALKKTTGLTDVKMRVYNPADVLVNEYTMVEVAASSGDASLGLYRKSFTPTTDGQWIVRIESIVNGDDISKIFEIGNYNLDDVKAQTQSIEDKEDIIDGNVDQALLDVAAVKGVVDSTEGKVDQTLLDVAAVKGVVDSTETKVDGVVIDIAAVKAQTQSIEDKVDTIDLQINAGGYIL